MIVMTDGFDGDLTALTNSAQDAGDAGIVTLGVSYTLPLTLVLIISNILILI